MAMRDTTTSGRLTPDQAAARICILETIGRVSGRLHAIEMWFAAGDDGTTLYLLSGSGERADWVRNLRKTPVLWVRIGEARLAGTGEVIAGTPEELTARRALAAKYFGWRDGPLPTDWGPEALAVAIRLGPPTAGERV